MAEAIGIAASIIQIAGTGVKLSTTLYNFVGSATRAEQDIADIADDVKLTATALDSVGKVFENEDGKGVVSKKAIQDAGGLIKRCETVFGEIQEVIEKRRKVSKDGKRSLSTLGKFSWPLKDQRVELLRRRLESLKNSLMLLLHVLQLANGQARGDLEKSALDQERERIRELHQRQQDSLKALQALESKLSKVSLDDDETLHGSSAPSRVPTIDFIVNPSLPNQQEEVKERETPAPMLASATATTLTDDSDTSDSDDTVTDDDREQLTIDELSKCAKHVQKLLKRITVLQQSFELTTKQSNSRYPKHRVKKLYRQFCRKFESEIVVRKIPDALPTAPLPEFVPLSKAPDGSGRQPQKPAEAPPHHLVPWEPQVPSSLMKGSDTLSRSLPLPPIAAIQPSIQPSAEVARRGSFYPNTGSAEVISERDQPIQNLHRVREAENSVLTGPAGEMKSETPPSREGPKEASQSATPTDNEQMTHGTASIQYTRTGRISKAKKGLKVHNCNECGKSFTRAEHLRRHQVNHSDNQYGCDLCGKVFYRADLRQRHRDRHKAHTGSASSARVYPHPMGAFYNTASSAPQGRPEVDGNAKNPIQLISSSRERNTMPEPPQQTWSVSPPQVVRTGRSRFSPRPVQLLPQPSNYSSARVSQPASYHQITPTQQQPAPQQTQQQQTAEASGAWRFPSSAMHSSTPTDTAPVSSSFENTGSTRDVLGIQPFQLPLTTSSPNQKFATRPQSSHHHKGPPLFSPGSASPYPHLPRTLPQSIVHGPSNLFGGIMAGNNQGGPAPAAPPQGFEQPGGLMSHASDAKSTRRPGGRALDSRLSQEAVDNAKDMRRISACFNCRKLREKCDPEAPCQTCLRYAHRPGYLPESTCRGQPIVSADSPAQNRNNQHGNVPGAVDVPTAHPPMLQPPVPLLQPPSHGVGSQYYSRAPRLRISTPPTSYAGPDTTNRSDRPSLSRLTPPQLRLAKPMSTSHTPNEGWSQARLPPLQIGSQTSSTEDSSLPPQLNNDGSHPTHLNHEPVEEVSDKPEQKELRVEEREREQVAMKRRKNDQGPETPPPVPTFTSVNDPAKHAASADGRMDNHSEPFSPIISTAPQRLPTAGKKRRNVKSLAINTSSPLGSTDPDPTPHLRSKKARGRRGRIGRNQYTRGREVVELTHEEKSPVTEAPLTNSSDARRAEIQEKKSRLLELKTKRMLRKNEALIAKPVRSSSEVPDRDFHMDIAEMDPSEETLETHEASVKEPEGDMEMDINSDVSESEIEGIRACLMADEEEGDASSVPVEPSMTTPTAETQPGMQSFDRMFADMEPHPEQRLSQSLKPARNTHAAHESRTRESAYYRHQFEDHVNQLEQEYDPEQEYPSGPKREDGVPLSKKRKLESPAAVVEPTDIDLGEENATSATKKTPNSEGHRIAEPDTRLDVQSSGDSSRLDKDSLAAPPAEEAPVIQAGDGTKRSGRGTSPAPRSRSRSRSRTRRAHGSLGGSPHQHRPGRRSGASLDDSELENEVAGLKATLNSRWEQVYAADKPRHVDELRKRTAGLSRRTKHSPAADGPLDNVSKEEEDTASSERDIVDVLLEQWTVPVY